MKTYVISPFSVLLTDTVHPYERDSVTRIKEAVSNGEWSNIPPVFGLYDEYLDLILLYDGNRRTRIARDINEPVKVNLIESLEDLVFAVGKERRKRGLHVFNPHSIREMKDYLREKAVSCEVDWNSLEPINL